jgi:hypothetical protein
MPGSPDAWRKGAARMVIEVAVAQGVRVLAGLPGSMTRTLIDRYGEREIEMEIDAEGHHVVPRAPKVLSCRQRVTSEPRFWLCHTKEDSNRVYIWPDPFPSLEDARLKGQQALRRKSRVG